MLSTSSAGSSVIMKGNVPDHFRIFPVYRIQSTDKLVSGLFAHSGMAQDDQAEIPAMKLTLKVLNFWKFTSYCSLKPLWSGMGEVVPARTSPTLHPPSPPTVHQLSWLAL